MTGVLLTQPFSSPFAAEPAQDHPKASESSKARERAQLELLRATLRHAAENTPYYGQALGALDLDINSLEDLRRLPLLGRETLAQRGTELLVRGTAPEYTGITSGTTFGDGSREPLLHYQTEDEHKAWRSLYASVAEGASGDRPLMVRLTDADRGVEIAGAFPGCFSLPMENLYHFELILSILRREWPFEGFSKRVTSLSGPLDALQLLTLLCLERNIDPNQFGIGVISSSGWQMTSRWRRLLERNWSSQVQDVYGVSEAPGMFAVRCPDCSHYHFSPLSVIEVLRLGSDEPVHRGIGRVIVTCLLPLASAQPIIRYDTGDVIAIVDDGGLQPFGFEYVGRRSKVAFLDGDDGPEAILSPLLVTEILDSMPDVAVFENAKAQRFGLRRGFGWPRYTIADHGNASPRRIDVTVELRWSPVQYSEAAQDLSAAIRRRVFDASPALAHAVERQAIGFEVHLAEPGALN